MKHPDIKEVIALVGTLVAPMYTVKRDITPPGRPEAKENIAEHSWSLAMLASVLAPQIDPRLDVGKLCQLALVHDVPEIHAGDISAMNKAEYASSQKLASEKQAAVRLVNDFPNLPWLHDGIEEYKNLQSREARFVYALDKLIPIIFDYLDEGVYLRRLRFTQAMYEDHLTVVRDKAQQYPEVGEYYDQVLQMMLDKPEWFIQPSAAN